MTNARPNQQKVNLHHYSFIRIQEPEPRYGTDVALGALHPRQVLGDSLPLLSPSLEVPTFATTCLCVLSDARDPSSEKDVR